METELFEKGASLKTPKNLESLVADQFPMLNQKMNNHPLVYLDSAATSLKPRSVLESIQQYYEKKTTNVHRSIHSLGEEVTTAYEGTRDTLKEFINAKKREEIIFTKGTTESLNLLARTLGDQLQSEDEIILSELEHHSNIIPWQLSSQRTGAKLKVAKINDRGEINLEHFESLLGEKTRIVSLTGLSNVIGSRTPIKKISSLVKKYNAKLIIDAAQLVVHEKIDVQDLGVDFLTFSAHKLFGPNGVGVLYGKEELLEALPPFLGGGDMIDQVSFEKTTYNELPYKFEAGTPNISGVIAFQKSLELLNSLSFDEIKEHDLALLRQCQERLLAIPGLTILGNPEEKGAIISFTIKGVHNHDLASIVSMEGIALRTGHHCAQPLHKTLEITSSARVSFTLYNNQNDLERLDAALRKAQKILN